MAKLIVEQLGSNGYHVHLESRPDLYVNSYGQHIELTHAIGEFIVRYGHLIDIEIEGCDEETQRSLALRRR